MIAEVVLHGKKKIIGLTAFLVMVALAVDTPAQQDTPGASKILVGALQATPFAMKTADGVWEGLSIELWQSIAQAMAVDYEVIQYEDIDRLKMDLERGVLDVFISMVCKISTGFALGLWTGRRALVNSTASALPCADSRTRRKVSRPRPRGRSMPSSSTNSS